MENVRINVLDKDKTQEHIEVLLETVSARLATSLGPSGSTTIVQNQQGHFMTKDGFTILKALRFNNPVLNTILDIIREACTQLVMKVGDGSTSTVVAANHVYKEIKTLLKQEQIALRPKEVIDTLTRLVDKIIEQIELNAKPISDDMHEIDSLAAISLNNDVEIGSLIADIYRQAGTGGFINVKLSTSTKTYYERSQGFQLDFGYLDKILVNTDTDECVLTNSAILMFDAQLTEEHVHFVNAAINKVNGENGKSITLIAPSYSTSVAALFRQLITYQYKQAGFRSNVNIIKFPLGTEMDENAFYDLATKTGATIVQLSLGDEPDATNPEKYFGHAGRVISNYKTTTLFDTAGDEDQIKIRIGNIKNEIKIMKEEGTHNPNKMYELQKRLAILENLLFTIHVGGNSEHARITDKYLIEDAIAACKSALKHGYVIGQNLSIPIAIVGIIEDVNLTDDERTLLSALLQAFRQVFLTVLRNKYVKESDEPIINDIFDKCMEKGMAYDLIRNDYTSEAVINSAETEYEILRNVVSIISLLVLSNQFIEVNPTTPL